MPSCSAACFATHFGALSELAAGASVDRRGRLRAGAGFDWVLVPAVMLPSLSGRASSAAAVAVLTRL